MPRADADAVAQAVGGLLKEPLRTVEGPRARFRITELGKRRRREQMPIDRDRDRYSHQRDGLRGAEKDVQLRPVGEPRSALGRGKIQLEVFQLLGGVETNFESAGGDFRRMKVIVRRVKNRAELAVVTCGDETFHLGVVEVVTGES